MQPNAIMRRAAPWLIGAGGLLLFTPGLGQREFMHLEARFALFAQEMLRQGVSAFPTVYGAPYPDYPATGTILIDLFSRIPGAVTTLTAVLPTAAAAALTLVFTYLIGALFSPLWGLYAVLFELCSYQFLASARSVSLDPFVTLATTASFYGAYSSLLLPGPKRVWLIPVGLLLGFIMRGPIGLIIPAAVIAVFYLIERQWRRFVLTSIVSGGLLALGTAVLLAAARAQGGDGFADQVLRAEAIGRMTGAMAHPPIYAYPVNALAAFALSVPVAAALAGMAFGALIRPVTDEWRLLRHLAAWFVVVMAGLSIPSKQEIRYLLPVVPAAALMAAALLTDLPSNRRLQLLRRWVVRLFLLIPWLGLGVMVAGLTIARVRARIPDDAQMIPAGVILAVLAGLMVAVRRRLREPAARELATVALGVAAFVSVTLLIVEPIGVDLNRVKPFVEQVRMHRTAGGPIAFYRIGPDGADIKFMAALDEPVRPRFVHTPEEVIGLPPTAVVIAMEAEFNSWPAEVTRWTRLLATGRIARARCVAVAVEPATISAPGP